MSTHNIPFSIKKKRKTPWIIPNLQLWDILLGTQKRVRNSRGKRAISVRATEDLLYIEQNMTMFFVFVFFFECVLFAASISHFYLFLWKNAFEHLFSLQRLNECNCSLATNKTMAWSFFGFGGNYVPKAQYKINYFERKYFFKKLSNFVSPFYCQCRLAKLIYAPEDQNEKQTVHAWRSFMHTDSNFLFRVTTPVPKH